MVKRGHGAKKVEPLPNGCHKSETETKMNSSVATDTNTVLYLVYYTV